MILRAGCRRLLAAVLTLSLPAVLSAQINTDRMMSVGRTALYYDDYVLSIQYFNQVINAKPYLYEPYFYRAVAKLSLEDYRGAEQDCNSSIDRNPFVVNSYQVRGLSLIYQDRYEEAVRDFRKGLSLDPENRPLRHNLILCLARQNKYEEALLAADTLLSISPKYTPAMAMKSNLLWEKNDTTGALEWIDKAVGIDRYDAGLLQDRGLLLARMERYSEAEPDLDKAIYLDPANAGIYINRAMVRYFLDNLNGALSDYDMAVRIDPGNVIGHYNRGNLRAQIGDDNRAIEDFDMVIEAEPDNMMAIFYRGLLRHGTGDNRGAERDLTRVLEEFPQFIYGYQLRAEVRDALGDRRGAEQDALVVLREQSRRFNDLNNPDRKDNGSDDDNADSGKTRNKSDKNVYNYRKIVVADDLENSTGFSSEYRGKVQNRNVNVQYLSSYRLSYYRTPEQIDRRVTWSPLLEALSSNGVFMSQVYMDCRDVTLDQTSINSLFEDIDRLTAKLADAPSDADVLLARALDFCLLQDYQSALDDLDEAVKSGSGNWAVWFCRAQVRARELEMRKADREMNPQHGNSDEKEIMIDPGYQAVINDLTQVLGIVPDFQYALYNRGTYYAITNDLHAALIDLDKAIEADGTLAEAWYNRGIVEVFLGRMDEAFRDLGKAGELGIYSAYNIIKRFSKSE
ncbi:MAG: tetratricopeptide repeat protein [Bacteroidaceae bacterium]|nr:tetratricopeptide repeat protein [Bacteroidaceae bacterium]